MPLLRSLGLRVLDKYVDENSLPVSAGVCNEFQSQSGWQYILPEEDYVCRLTKVGTVLSKNGHIWDFSNSTTHQTQADYFGPTSTGYRIDSANRDDLLRPDDLGNFSIAFWILPYQHSGLFYDVIGKRLTGIGLHRYLIRVDGSIGPTPEVVFIVANQAGTAEFEVRCPLVSGRWSLVVARCEGTVKKHSLAVLCEDGTVTTASEDTTDPLGCSLPGSALVLGRNPDLVSNTLSTGVFFLQQVCMWKKLLTTSEEQELFFDGRGVIRWTDPAVPVYFGDFGSVSQIHKKYGTSADAGTPTVYRDGDGNVTLIVQSGSSPASPCKVCDAEPACWPEAMPDYSPDAITLSVDWTAASGGCVPIGTDFTLHRNSRQIVQGFRFGRTYESDAITLPCGGTLTFFLESTPYHMSQYRYRQYLGIETTFGGKTQIAKFNITLGVALIKPSTTGNFTSPSPSGTNFNFPYSDSFSDYANDIVAAGWTDFAAILHEEPFSATANYPAAACLVANGYRFTVGSDTPEKRGGDCGWQMGVKDLSATAAPASVLDSKYNYRAVGSTISNNPRLVPSDPLLNRPFAAVARGLVSVVDDEGELIDGSGLPFVASSFTGVMTASEFVRPEPFTYFLTNTRRFSGVGGCIDCDVTASIPVESLPSGTPAGSRTVKILKTQCPQKTLSGAVGVAGMGAITGSADPALGLRNVLGLHTPGDPYIDRSSNNRPLHVGGTFTPSGTMQFTGQIQNFDSQSADLIIDVRPDDKVDLNNPGTYTGTIAGATKLVFNGPDMGTIETVPYGVVPDGADATITVDNCTVAVCPPFDNRVVELDRTTCPALTGGPLTTITLSPFRMADFVSPITSPCWTGTFTGSGTGSGSLLAIAGCVCSGFPPFPVPTFIGTKLFYTSECAAYYFRPGTGICHAENALQKAALFGPVLNPYSTGAKTTQFVLTGSTLEYVAAIKKYQATFSYSYLYTENLDVYVTSTVNAIAGTCSAATTLIDLIPVPYYVRHNRLATFLSDVEDTDCLDVAFQQNQFPHRLSFVSDVLVSKGDFNGMGPSTSQAALDARITSAVLTRFRHNDPCNVWSPVTMAGTSISGATYNGPFVACADCGIPNPPSGTATMTGTASTATGLDPNLLSPSTVIDFTGAYINLNILTSIFPPVGYPDEFTCALSMPLTAYDGDHTLAYANDRFRWKRFVTGSLFSMLDIHQSVLEFYETPLVNTKRTVARYRLPGFPDSRWNRTETNQMQLVSADWSIGDWPIYITVEPVV